MSFDLFPSGVDGKASFRGRVGRDKGRGRKGWEIREKWSLLNQKGERMRIREKRSGSGK